VGPPPFGVALAVQFERLGTAHSNTDMNGVVLAWSLFCAGLCFDARTLHSLALGDLDVRPAAITILTIAGASFATGRSVVMFINRGGRSCLL
jgi:hypothetical protein